MKVYVPGSLPEALKMKEENPSFLWLAGGSDIMVYQKSGRISPEGLIAIQYLPELQKVRFDDGLQLGAGLTFSQLLDNPLVQEHAPDLIDALRTVGSIQVRNQGTLGGNIANASPAGDTLPVLYLREAVLNVCNQNGERKVKIQDVINGPRAIALEKDELICSVSLPVVQKPTRYGFFKVAPRKALAITKVSLAFHEFSSYPDWNGAIALGAVGPTIIRPLKTEEYLRGRPFSKQMISAVKSVFMNEVQAIDDIRSTSVYRSEVAFELLMKALLVN